MPSSDFPTGPPSHRVHLTLTANNDAPGHFRSVLRAVAPAWALPADVLDRALLLGSELVTNAVTHGRDPVSATVSTDNGLLRIAVHDGEQRHPTYRAPTPDTTGGAGLRLLDTVAYAWGVEDHSPGKTVWCIILSP